MYKVMIVDDEWLVQEGIKVSLESNFNDINIVGMASSGRQAIEMSQDLNPDIIFMDIKMPGIDGIEAIEAIKQRLKSVKFVVVSAYEQFSYAKKAVELGVSHYILKPIHQEKLIGVVKGILKDLRDEQLRREQRIANKEKLEKALPILEKGFIYSMLMNTDFKSEIAKYKDLFEIKRDYAFVCVIEIGSSEEASLLTEIQSNDLYPKIQNMVKYKCKSVIGPMIINRITLVILDQDFEYEYEQRLHAMNLVSSIQERMNDITDLPVKIGIGSSCLLEKIKVSLDEANYTLSRTKESGSLHYNDVFESDDRQGYSYIEIKDDQQAIINAMENAKKTLLLSLLNSFFIRLKEKYHQDLIGLRHHITELMVMVMSASYRNTLLEKEAGFGTYLA
jgi:two-component system response regulator YesN